MAGARRCHDPRCRGLRIADGPPARTLRRSRRARDGRDHCRVQHGVQAAGGAQRRALSMAFDAAWVVDFTWPAERAQDTRSAGIVAACVACGARAMRAIEGTAARLYFAADAVAAAAGPAAGEAVRGRCAL